MRPKNVLNVERENVAGHPFKRDININIYKIVPVAHIYYQIGLRFMIHVLLDFEYAEANQHKSANDWD